MSDTSNDFVQGEDPDIEVGSGPDPELGAPGGDDSTVGTSAEGDVADPKAEDDKTGEYGPGVDRDTGAGVGDTGSPELSD